MVQKVFKNRVKNAINNGDLEGMRSLLTSPGSDSMPDPDMPLTGSGKTALMLAAREGRLCIAWLLVDGGADVLVQDDEGRSALMRACEGGHLELVIYLVHRGSDVLQWNIWGRTPLLIAAFFGHWHVVQFLASHGAGVGGSSIDGKSALHVAVERDFARVVSVLVDFGISIHKRSSAGETAIQLAATHGNLEIVDILLSRGADKTEGLCAACAAGNLPVARHLVAMGADCNAPDAQGWTPIMHCCAADHMATAAFMLATGADMGAQTADGRSVHSLATGACRAQLERGPAALFEMSTIDDKILWALHHESSAVVLALFQESGLSLNDPLEHKSHGPALCATAFGRDDMLADIILAKTQYSAIMLASRRGLHTVVEQLVSLGADVGSKDAANRTCLMRAAQEGHLATVAVLAAAGKEAAVNATDRDGWTALTYACKGGFLGIVKLLVYEHNADVGSLDIHGKTVIHYADKGTHYDVVSFLFTVRARKSLSIIVKYLSSKDFAVVKVGLSCLESILPHGAGADSLWQSPTATAAVLCSDDIVEVLKQIAINGPDDFRLRAESLLLVSSRYKEYDIFKAIDAENWSLVLEIAESDGSATRDRADRLPLHHLLNEAGGACDQVTVERLLALYPAAAAAVDPSTAMLPVVSAVLCNVSSSIVSALITAYPLGVDSIAELPRDVRNRFWTTTFSLEALSASQHLLWLTMVQLTDVDYADYFIQRILSNFPDLVYVVDSNNRSAYELATAKNRFVMQPLMLWHGRYFITSAAPEHVSDTSVVLMAYDTLTLDDTGAGTKVALKLMKYKSAFETERLARSIGFDTQCVVPVLAMFPDPDTDISGYPAEQHLSLSNDRALCKKQGEKMYTLVMPWADRNLYVSLKQDKLGGQATLEARKLVVQLAGALQHMHEKAVVHGDIQPLNIMRVGGVWKLIDLDACCPFGSILPLRNSSSAYVPPEAIHVDTEGEFACLKSQTYFNAGIKCDPLLADPSFDLWGLGCVLYQLYHPNVKPLFVADRDDNLSSDQSDADSLYSLATWTDDYKFEKLNKIQDVLVRNLLSQLLSRDLSRRPSLDRVLAHPFVSGNSVARLIGEDPAFDVFVAHKGNIDMTHALLIRNKLVECGLRVWCKDTIVSKPHDVDVVTSDALMSSRTFVCLLSRSSLEGVASMSAASPADPLLLQCRMALELKQTGLISDIFALLVGDKVAVGDEEVYGKFFESGCMPKVDDVCVQSIDVQLGHFLKVQALGRPVLGIMGVDAIVRAISQCHPCLIEGARNRAWDTAIGSISSLLDCEKPAGGENNSTTTDTTFSSVEHTVIDLPLPAVVNASVQTPENFMDYALSIDRNMFDLESRKKSLENEIVRLKSREKTIFAGSAITILCMATLLCFKLYKHNIL